GGGRVYLAAGSRGVYALNNANGSVVWKRSNIGAVNSTPAYDPDTGALFVLGANGTLYKLNAATGQTLASFPSGASSDLPLQPAIAGQRVFFSMGRYVYALDKYTLGQIWRYDAGSPVDTPPAYSASRNLVVVASRDLYVHGIRNGDGSRAWRVKHTPLQPGDPGISGSNDYAEVGRGWPVVADRSGIVLIKLRLDWQSLWDWDPRFMTNNVAMRQHLQNNPDQKALLALSLDNGNEVFLANVPHAGFGDGGYMPMGPMPVIKTFPDGKQIAYVVMRGGPCKQDPCDSRWDSHLGEMMLDNQTVSDLLAGYVRYMQNTFFPSDEQAFLSMAGDHIFAAHWEAGIAHKIEDRSPSRGTSTNPITVSDLPHIATSQDNDVCGSSFQRSHYCADGLSNTRNWPPGFYIYWGQGAVYDQYWSGYAQWVISRDTLYFVSTDGAVVALEHGNPSAASEGHSSQGILAAPVAEPTPVPPPNHVLSPEDTWAYVGQTVTVQGKLAKVFNNRKAVYLTFSHPHQGRFIIRILKPHWDNFLASPEQLYTVGQEIRATGKLGWYQGAPVMLIETPAQIQIVGGSISAAP
ncbi:MAG: PQQ-binding-like beta-propeller repeat protein, partial [Anaerolineales bacterium]|nr:PQQ-like beta-propeller repeat protein [Anaerolineales bacterium]MDW8446324.1 PQQ-binding-like beta-propeller repeat protein [Anaerolineales bacterium]